MLLFQSLGHFVYFERDNLTNVFTVEGTENDNRIETVDEFRTEVSLQSFHELLLHILVFQLFFFILVHGQREAKPTLASDKVCTNVSGHDDDGIAEIHLETLGICQVTFFHYLQKQV